MRVVNLVLDWLVRASAVLACIMLATMTVLITLEVVLRAFQMTMLFTEEYSGYMVLAIMALGVAYSREQNALLTVDFFIDRLGARARRTLHLAYGVASLAFCLLLNYHLTQFVLTTIERNLFAATQTMTPLWIPQILFPIGLTLLSLVVARKLFRPDAAQQDAAAIDIAKE